jgi:hypothetical protein
MRLMNSSDLGVLIRSRVPILAVDSVDEAQVIKAILRTNGHGHRTGETGYRAIFEPTDTPPVFQWTVTDGLKRLDVPFSTPQRTINDPAEVLKHIRAS